MKVKMLALCLLASANVCSAQTLGPGVTLVQHIVTHGESLPAAFKNMPNTKSVGVTASANYASGMHGETITATGLSSGKITNNYNSTKIYYVDSYMCIANNNCNHDKDTYTLLAGASFNIGGPGFTNGYLENAGTYEDEMVIAVSGTESQTAKGTNTVRAY